MVDQTWRIEKKNYSDTKNFEQPNILDMQVKKCKLKNNNYNTHKYIDISPLSKIWPEVGTLSQLSHAKNISLLAFPIGIDPDPLFSSVRKVSWRDPHPLKLSQIIILDDGKLFSYLWKIIHTHRGKKTNKWFKKLK